jgi:hypothetical protein
MRQNGNNATSTARRRLAVLSAALILMAGLLGAAHSHRYSLQQLPSASAQISAEDGLCAFCLLAFHSPTNPASGFTIFSPEAASERIVPASSYDFRSYCLSSSLTRAPPSAA